MSKIILLLFLVLITYTERIYSNDCIKACEKFVTCSEEMNKRKATQNERETLLQHCSKTCAKRTAQVMGCFSQGVTCASYAQCILTQAKKK